MPGQRFGYPVGSHYTGVRGVRDYSRHIRSTHRTSNYWRRAAFTYASRLGKFALRRLGPFGAAYTAYQLGEQAYSAIKQDNMPRYIDGWPVSTDGQRKRARYAESRGAAVDASGTVKYVKRKTGRKKPYGYKVNSLMKCLVSPQVESWRALTSNSDSTGYYTLNWKQATAADDSFLPVYLFELNNLHNRQFTARSRFGTGCWQLKRADASPFNFYLDPITHYDNESAAPWYTWDRESFQSASPSDTLTPHAYLDWVDIRLLLQGPRKFHTRVKVSLVRFKDDACTPDVYDTTAVGVAPSIDSARARPTSTSDLAEWNNMWLELITPLLANPIANRTDSNLGRKIHVVKSMTFDFQPRDTSDDGPTGGIGDQKVVKWFNRVEKNFKYRMLNPATSSVDNDEMGIPQEGFSAQVPYYSTSAHNRARLFLMVTAYCPAQDTTAAPLTASDYFASFDVLLRRKFYFHEAP